MATIVRPEISIKNPYWISKHRYYELKHFCLQYPSWKKTYSDLNELSISAYVFDAIPKSKSFNNPTESCAIRKAYYSERIDMIEKAAIDADEILQEYILKAVTEGLSYTYLKTNMRIPCSKDIYYDRYRRFFWLLSKERN